MKEYIKSEVTYCTHLWYFAPCFKGNQYAMLSLEAVSQIADGAAVFQHLKA